MKIKYAVAVGCLLLGCFCFAQSEKRTLSQVLDGSVKIVESEFVPAAEAMPEDKYDFAPTTGEFKGSALSGGRSNTSPRLITW